MFGSDTTSGLVRNRSSSKASGTTNTSGCWIAVEQNAMSREVSVAEIPTLDLNHCLFSSINEISAMGVLQTYEANSVRSSKACSGSLSKIAYLCKAATRAASFADIMGAPMIDLPGISALSRRIILHLGRVSASLQQIPGAANTTRACAANAVRRWQHPRNSHHTSARSGCDALVVIAVLSRFRPDGIIRERRYRKSYVSAILHSRVNCCMTWAQPPREQLKNIRFRLGITT